MTNNMFQAHKPAPSHQRRLDDATWHALLNTQMGATHATTGVAS